MKVVLASNNAGKVKEMQNALDAFGWEIVPQSAFDLPSVEETGLTFVENALLKARYASEATGLPAIADDSGLAVDALGGVPGLYSSRYAGENATDQENCEKLLNALCHEADRRARFISCIVFLRHPTDPTPLIAIGEYAGEILTAPRGENGFGYDPIFFSPEKNCSFAELDLSEKKRISHRARALAQLKNQLENRQ